MKRRLLGSVVMFLACVTGCAASSSYQSEPASTGVEPTNPHPAYWGQLQAGLVDTGPVLVDRSCDDADVVGAASAASDEEIPACVHPLAQNPCLVDSEEQSYQPDPVGVGGEGRFFAGQRYALVFEVSKAVGCRASLRWLCGTSRVLRWTKVARDRLPPELNELATHIGACQ